MDKLDTCMICDWIFQKGETTVAVRDAEYIGFYHDNELATHEPYEEPERGVYCQDCYSYWVLYSRDLREDMKTWKIAKGWEKYYKSKDDGDK